MPIGLQTELWEATTASVRVLPAFEQKENTTAVSLKLAPYESVFVVFSKPANKAKAAGIEGNYPKMNLVADLKGPWRSVKHGVPYIPKMPKEPCRLPGCLGRYWWDLGVSWEAPPPSEAYPFPGFSCLGEAGNRRHRVGAVPGSRPYHIFPDHSTSLWVSIPPCSSHP